MPSDNDDSARPVCKAILLRGTIDLASLSIASINIQQLFDNTNYNSKCLSNDNCLEEKSKRRKQKIVHNVQIFQIETMNNFNYLLFSLVDDCK